MPARWVDKLFSILAVNYGARLADAWPGVDLSDVKSEWAISLGRLSREDIARGVNLLRSRPPKYVPMLPDFLEMCRIDPEDAYNEAQMQMPLRLLGKDQWTMPAAYWAALDYGGFDFRNSNWSNAKAKYSRLLANRLQGCPPVPPHREALPEPGATSLDRDEFDRRMLDLASRFPRMFPFLKGRNPMPFPEKPC